VGSFKCRFVLALCTAMMRNVLVLMRLGKGKEGGRTGMGISVSGDGSWSGRLLCPTTKMRKQKRKTVHSVEGWQDNTNGETPRRPGASLC